MDVVEINEKCIEYAKKYFYLDELIENSKERLNIIIDDAINFYCGYLTADDCADFYPEVIKSAVKANLDSLENRMGRLLFKHTVELAMMMNLFAAVYNLRAKCVSEVKRLNGKISFEDVYRYQKGEE